jgi:hypothetical protein
MTNAVFIQIGVGFGVVVIDAPANFGVDEEFCVFKNMPGEQVDLRAIVQKRIRIDFMIDDNICTPRWTYIKLLEIAKIDVCIESEEDAFAVIAAAGQEGLSTEIRRLRV